MNLFMGMGLEIGRSGYDMKENRKRSIKMQPGEWQEILLWGVYIREPQEKWRKGDEKYKNAKHSLGFTILQGKLHQDE